MDLPAEVNRVRESVHRLAERMQSVLISHAEVSTLVQGQGKSLDTITEMLETLQNSTNDLSSGVKQLNSRVQILERVVFGACAIILIAFVTALASGVIHR